MDFQLYFILGNRRNKSVRNKTQDQVWLVQSVLIETNKIHVAHETQLSIIAHRITQLDHVVTGEHEIRSGILL